MSPTIHDLNRAAEETPVDRELQSKELARIMAESYPQPVIFLGYVVTKPHAKRPAPYEIMVSDGKVPGQSTGRECERECENENSAGAPLLLHHGRGGPFVSRACGPIASSVSHPHLTLTMPTSSPRPAKHAFNSLA